MTMELPLSLSEVIGLSFLTIGLIVVTPLVIYLLKITQDSQYLKKLLKNFK